MICTRCGTQNSKTSKYCRECGKRLILEALEIEAEADEEQVGPPDDAAMAELLHEAFKLYERGKIDASFAKCRLALRMNPDSPSGHSLLGLIYEKKADRQLEKGNREDTEDYLHAAIRQIERVLEENPDSVADREKLSDLRLKLEVLTETGEVKQMPLRTRALAAARRTPLAWRAGAGTFALVFIVLAVVFLRGGNEPAKKERPPQAAQAGQPGQQLPPPVYTPSVPQPQGWTYQPQPPAAPPQMYSPAPQTPYQPPQPQPETQSALPALTPYPTGESESAPARPEQALTPAPERKPAERARAAYMRGDYESAAVLYEEAIASGEDTGENQQKLGMCLYNLGKRDTAISHFQRAVQLYMAQKANGIDVDTANKAIDTCKLYIDDLSRR